MKQLLSNCRFYVLISTLLISLGVYSGVSALIASGSFQVIRLEEIYALLSLCYLYITLLIGPFCYLYRNIPFRQGIVTARRAVGVSACYFALLHSGIALIGQLGGFQGLSFLSTDFLIAVIVGFIALGILVILTLTSFDKVVKKMSFKNWKLVHRFVYLAGILILIHTVLLGTHYTDLSTIIPQITFVALSYLLLLESLRTDAWLTKHVPIPRFGLSTILCSVILSVIYFTILFPLVPKTNSLSFDIHAAHRLLAQQALQANQPNSFPSFFSNGINSRKIPGLDGDRTKRYTVSLLTPDTLAPNQDIPIRFRTYDASNGTVISLYKIIYAKPMHLIITNSSLSYFSHIHPIQEGSDFVITTQFPQPDIYHIYIEFQPWGGIEQQDGFTIPVGISTGQPNQSATQLPDKNFTKKFGNYMVTLNTHGVLRAQDMTLGKDKITFSIKDAQTQKPITTLKPYLAAFGHLTMINEKTYDFLHVHPYTFTAPSPTATSGPLVDFLPIGIYGPFKPGIYRLFAEFNPNGTVFTADFTVEVK